MDYGPYNSQSRNELNESSHQLIKKEDSRHNRHHQKNHSSHPKHESSHYPQDSSIQNHHPQRAIERNQQPVLYGPPQKTRNEKDSSREQLITAGIPIREYYQAPSPERNNTIHSDNKRLSVGKQYLGPKNPQNPHNPQLHKQYLEAPHRNEHSKRAMQRDTQPQHEIGGPVDEFPGKRRAHAAKGNGHLTLQTEENKTDEFIELKRTTNMDQDPETEGAGLLAGKQKPGEYNPFLRPPDFEFAKRHALAKRVGTVSQHGRVEKEDVCPCCQFPVNNEPLSICCNPKSLSILGPGFTLYFEFLVYLMILMLLLLVTIGINALSANAQGGNCWLYRHHEDFPCERSIIVYFSLGNRSQTDPWNSDSLNIMFVFLAMVSLLIYRKRANKTCDIIDKDNITPSDYTIMAENFPKETPITEIEEFFRYKSMPKCYVEIKKVVPCYFIGDFVEMNKQKHKLEAKIWAAQRRGEEEERKSLVKEMEELNKKIDAFEKECSQGLNDKFTGTVFVTYQKLKECDFVVDRWKMSGIGRVWNSFGSDNFRHNGNLIKVRRAPEPTDIWWENIGHPFWDVLKKRIMTAIASFFFLGICFGTILGIQYVQWKLQTQDLKGSAASLLMKIFSFGASLVITIVNSLLALVFRKFSHYEKYPTITRYNVAVSQKIALAQFFNTALLTLVVNVIIQKPIQRGADSIIPVWVEGGLVNDIFSIFMVNTISPTVMALLKPDYFYQLYKRRQALKEGKDSNLNQQQANELFEGPPIDMPTKYAHVLKTVFLAAFYAKLLPMGILFALLSIILAYWTDKYLLLRRHSRPVELGSDLSTEMTEVLELVVLIFATGNVILDKIYYGFVNSTDITCLVIAIIFQLIPGKVWEKCTSIKEGEEVQKDYDVVKFSFMNDYDRSNPITQEEATKAFFKEMMECEKDEQVRENMQYYFQQMQYNGFGGMAHYGMGYPQMRNPSYFGIMKNSNSLHSTPTFVPGMPQTGFHPFQMARKGPMSVVGFFDSIVKGTAFNATSNIQNERSRHETEPYPIEGQLQSYPPMAGNFFYPQHNQPHSYYQNSLSNQFMMGNTGGYSATHTMFPLPHHVPLQNGEEPYYPQRFQPPQQPPNTYSQTPWYRKPQQSGHPQHSGQPHQHERGNQSSGNQQQPQKHSMRQQHPSPSKNSTLRSEEHQQPIGSQQRLISRQQPYPSPNSDLEAQQRQKMGLQQQRQESIPRMSRMPSNNYQQNSTYQQQNPQPVSQQSRRHQEDQQPRGQRPPTNQNFMVSSDTGYNARSQSNQRSKTPSSILQQNHPHQRQQNKPREPIN